MLFLGAIVLGLVLGTVTGGRIDNLARIRFRAPWLVVAAVIVREAVLLTPLNRVAAAGYVYLAALAAIGAWTAMHSRSVRGMWVITAGVVLNLVVIAANGARMPVAPEIAGAALLSRGTIGQYTVMGSGCQTVTRVHTDGADCVTGRWKDGRIGTFRGLRRGWGDGAQAGAAREELGTDLVAVGMVDLLEDAQRQRPRPAGRTDVARAAVDVAEVVQRDGLVVAVGALPAQLDRPLVAGDGLLVVAQLVMDVAKAVPDRLLGAGLPQLLHPRQCPLAVQQRMQRHHPHRRLEDRNDGQRNRHARPRGDEPSKVRMEPPPNASAIRRAIPSDPSRRQNLGHS